MATYTPEQYGDVLERFLKELPKVTKEATLVAAYGLLGNMKKRIFNNGLDAKNQKIGDYSTTPTLIGKKSFPTLTAARKVLGSKSKRKKLEWRKFKGRNLAILDGGYKEIRQISDLRTDTVDLNFRGDLQAKTVIVEKKRFTDIIIKGKRMGVRNIDKARYNEKRFNTKIFEASKQEAAEVQEFVDKEINKLINKFFD